MSFYYYNLGMYFQEIVAIRGDSPALNYEDKKISFDKLNEWSIQLSDLLFQKGCTQGDVIAIGNTKRPLSYALMIAGLRLGIPYINLDIESPIERNLRILQSAKPKLIFYDQPLHTSSVQVLSEKINTEQILLEEKILPTVSNSKHSQNDDFLTSVDGSSVAYIMFTSGSTGIPKGVAVTHQNVLHFISWGKSRFNFSGKDNFANLSPMYFDNSVFDFYVGLFSGASLTPIFRELLNQPYELVSYIERMRCSVWFSVPSLLMYLVTMKAFVRDGLPTLRLIIFGGEGYPKVELKKLYDLFSSQAALVNVYGPTECTCICSAHTLIADDFQNLDGLPTLGALNPNFDYCILNDDGSESNYGELCLIGPNVAAGYFNDPERTNSSFITLLDSRRYMKRMYKTGDIVEKKGGNLYFISRKDSQIKHMGYRIELDEIEHALVGLPDIDQAAVIYKRVTTTYGKIIGFVASKKINDSKEILYQLSKKLPSYMIPSKLIILSELPKNPNGKVDRVTLLEKAL